MELSTNKFRGVVALLLLTIGSGVGLLVVTLTSHARRGRIQSPRPSSRQPLAPSPIRPERIEHIQLMDQKSWLIADSSSVWLTHDSGSSWTVTYGIADGRPGTRIHGLAFVDNQLGFLIADQTLLRTDDGGANWIEIGMISSGHDFSLENCFFLDSQRGWVVGAMWMAESLHNLQMPQYQGIILATRDGGRTWQRQHATLPPPENEIRWSLRAVLFSDSMRGWAAGDRVILRTSNGGEAWQVSRAPYADYGHIEFIDHHFGWATEWRGGRLAVTTDGGRQWKLLETLPSFGDWPSRVLFITPRHGFASSLALYETGDGGMTWKWRAGGNRVGDQTFDYVGRARDGSLVAIGLDIGGTTALISKDGGKSWHSPNHGRGKD